MNNYVKKHDHNRAGYHKDHKNDYDRSALKKDLESQLEENTQEEFNSDEESEEDKITYSLIYRMLSENCGKISLDEYERVRGLLN